MSKTPELEEINPALFDTMLYSEDVRERVISVIHSSSEIDKMIDKRIDGKLMTFDLKLQVTKIEKVKQELRTWIPLGILTILNIATYFNSSIPS